MLVSVIVPVYNAEQFLVECIESIINQTYQNIEIILIDDGSSDSSGAICDQYKLKTDIIKVFHINNNGVSNARNIGLKNCSGEYVCFIDSDDIVDPMYIEKMIEVSDKETDLVISNIHDIYLGKSHELYGRPINENMLTGSFKEDFFLLWDLLRVPVVKLYKYDIIRDNNIWFDTDMNCAEDQCFNFKYYAFVKKYSFINFPGYKYFHRDNITLSTFFSEETYRNNCYALNKAIDFLNNNDIKNKSLVITDCSLECVKCLLKSRDVSFLTINRKVKGIYEAIGSIPIRISIYEHSWKGIILNIFFKYKLIIGLWLCSKFR